MKPIITALASHALDEASFRFVPSLVLMEEAASKSCRFLEETGRIHPSDRILFLAGPGGNGGDALAMARILSSEGYRNLSVLCLEPLGAKAEEQKEMAEAFPIAFPSESEELFHEATVIIDGLFGVGLSRLLEGKALQWVSLANSAGQALKVAIDTPSGLGDGLGYDSPCFHADLTLTMGAAKLSLFHPLSCAHAGKPLVVINPCYPEKPLDEVEPVGEWIGAGEITDETLPLDGFKNSRGSVAMFAGCRAYSGAPRLAALAAFHAGAGLVTLYADPDAYAACLSVSASVMVRHLEDGYDLTRTDALLAGPGWGEGREELLCSLLQSGKPIVVDADGIKALGRLYQAGYRPEGNLVVTPHLGEMVTLSKAVLGRDIVHESAEVLFQGLRELARSLHATVVLKSAQNHITDGERLLVIDGKNPALGVAGSGDVLSGIIASRLAGGLGPFEAAVKGCALHQKQGLGLASGGFFTSEELEESL